jgi:hypothetical protein
MLESEGGAAGLRALCNEPKGVDEGVIEGIEGGSDTERREGSRGGVDFWESSVKSCTSEVSVNPEEDIESEGGWASPSGISF